MCLADQAVVPSDQREDGGDNRCHLWMQTQHRALSSGDLLLVVGVHEHRHEDPLDADRGLDDVGRVTLAVRPHVVQLRRRELRMPRQIVVAAIRDALEL